MTKKTIYTFVLIILISVFVGCSSKKETENIQINKNVTEKTAQEDSFDTQAIDQDIQALEDSSAVSKLKIIFTNDLNVEIGMISLIDPITDEQVNVSGLLDGEYIAIDSYIPKDTKELKWAVYNTNGDLYCESTTDLEKANESVWMILCGDGELKKIDVLYDKTEQDAKEYK